MKLAHFNDLEIKTKYPTTNLDWQCKAQPCITGAQSCITGVYWAVAAHYSTLPGHLAPLCYIMQASPQVAVAA